jgi:hypothetical protein
MSKSIRAAALIRANQPLAPHFALRRARVVGLAGLMLFVLAVGNSLAVPAPASAAAEPPAQSGNFPLRIVVEGREALNDLREQAAGLGERALVGLAVDAPTEGDLASQGLTVASADMLGQLEASVSEARAEDATARWAKLKPKIHGVAVRYLGVPAK